MMRISTLSLITILLVASFHPVHSFAQQDKPMQVSFHLGHSTISGDVLARSGFALGASLTRALSTNFSLRADYTGSMNYGMDVQPRMHPGVNDNSVFDPWHGYYGRFQKPFVANYKSAIHQLSLGGVINLYQYEIPSTNNFLKVYSTIGYSYMIADVDLDALNNNQQPYDFSPATINFNGSKREVRKQLKQLLDSKYESNAYHAETNTSRTKNFQHYHGINAGLGANYPLTEKFHVAAEYRLTAAFTDHLDGIKTGGGNEYIHYTSIRLAYSFGNRARKATRRMNPDGTKTIVTSSEELTTVSGFIQPEVHGEANISQTDSSYYLNFSFIPKAQGRITNYQMIVLKTESNKIIILPYAGLPAALKVDEAFSFRTRLTKDQLITLSNSKVIDIKIETSDFPLEGRITDNKQEAIADICKKLLQL